MPTFSYHIVKSNGLDLPHRHGLAQPSLDLTCGLPPWLDLCLITITRLVEPGCDLHLLGWGWWDKPGLGEVLPW